MSEDLTNKEIAGKIFDIMNARYPSSISQAEIALLTLAAERLKEAPDPMPDFIETGNSVIDFLLGSGEFMGKWYGETPPEGHKGNFWWRKYLRKFVDDNVPSNTFHKWKCISPGEYDSLYRCSRCKAEFMTQADAGISLPDHEICPAETKLGACEEEVSKDRLLPVKPVTDPYPNCERECGGLGQPCLCRIEDLQSSDGGVENSKEMDDWLKTFPKIPWYFLAWCWVKNLLPRCSAKSAGLQCCLRFPHFGKHHADWRVWDRKGVYQDRIGRLEEEGQK